MHIREERKLLLGLSAVFLVAALLLFGYGMTTKAEDSLIDSDMFPYNMSARWMEDSGIGTYITEKEVKIKSKLPVVGYYSDNKLTIDLALVDMDNHVYYTLKSKTDEWYFVCGSISSTNRDTLASSTYHEIDNRYYSGGYDGQLTGINLEEYGALYSYEGMLFDSPTNFKNYVATGDTTGMIQEGDAPRDFSGDYDPDVPIPQLTNLSHNGFTVTNASQLLELDCVVQSYSYGLKHTPKKTLEIGGFGNPFSRDNDWMLNSHYYDCTSNSEIGYTTDVYNLSETFGCSNAIDLYADVQGFFDSYPKHSDLPDYDWWNYGGIQYKSAYDEYVSLFAPDGVGADGASKCLNYTESAMTKYYVRFYELKESELTPGRYVMTPGRWYCYTYCAGESDSIRISPVTGDDEGNPVETDPVDGWQDPDTGEPIYGGGNLPEINTENPLTMLQGVLDFILALPDMLGELSEFLSAAFAFIPSKYWDIILAGVVFAVLFLVFRAVK